MNLGGPELLLIIAVIVLVFGASQIPKLARSLGQAQREFRKGLRDGEADEADGHREARPARRADDPDRGGNGER
jgi:sec-independent protein translocase protein TatA